MPNHTNLRRMTARTLVVCLAILIGVSACAPAGMDAGAPQGMNNPTVVVVQYVTQVVATTTPAPPTATPLPPTAKPVKVGFDPFGVQVYYPLVGCQIASRLHVGERAMVADNRNGTLGLHWTATVGDSPIFRKLNTGEVLEVIGGPFCRTNTLVWEVRIGENDHGFVSEGDGNMYWLLPMGEKVDKDIMKEAQRMQKLRARMGLPEECIPR